MTEPIELVYKMLKNILKYQEEVEERVSFSFDFKPFSMLLITELKGGSEEDGLKFLSMLHESWKLSEGIKDYVLQQNVQIQSIHENSNSYITVTVTYTIEPSK